MRSDQVVTATTRTDKSNSCFKTICGTVNSFKQSTIAFLLFAASHQYNSIEKRFLRNMPIMRQRFNMHPLFSIDNGPKKDYWTNDPTFKRLCEAVDQAEELYSRETNVPSGLSQSQVASNLRLEYKIDRLSSEVKAAVMSRTSFVNGRVTGNVNSTSQENTTSFTSPTESTSQENTTVKTTSQENTTSFTSPTECIPYKPRSRSNGIGPSAHIITISGFWREYAYGINGEPSLKSLIASRGKGKQLTRDFSRIVPLYLEIERRLGLKHEEDVVVCQLEELWGDLISALNDPVEHELRQSKVCRKVSRPFRQMGSLVKKYHFLIQFKPRSYRKSNSTGKDLSHISEVKICELLQSYHSKYDVNELTLN